MEISACYFDIETIPAQVPEMIAYLRAEMKADLDAGLDAIRAPANYKDEAKISEYVQAARSKMLAEHEASVQAEYLKTSFDGGLGQICAIGWAFDNDEPASVQVDDLTPASEAAMLRTFFDAIKGKPSQRVCFIGHNVIGFDLRFVWQRAMVHKIKPPFHFPRDPKPWSETVFDTMLAWSGLKVGGSMDKLCRVFGIAGKGEMDGSKVWPMVQAGQIEAVATYCRGDVDRTRQLHKRMTFA